MKKIIALLLSLIFVLSACSLQPSEAPSDTSEPVSTPEKTEAETTTEEATEALPASEVIIWTFGAEEELTKSLCEQFKASPSYDEQWTIVVKTVNAEDLISRMLESTDTSFTDARPDVEEMPDMFFFYSDDFERLHELGLLSPVPEEKKAVLKETIAPAALAAAEEEDGLFAYPSALEYTTLLYYDKSAVGEITDLTSLIKACGKADDRCFYVGTESALFPSQIFMSCGLGYDTELLPNGRIRSVSCDYYAEGGVEAARTILTLMSEPAFREAEGSPILAFAYEEERILAYLLRDCNQTRG